MSSRPLSLPSRTKILIVGAGPSGLAAAISLRKHGVPTENIVIVDRAAYVGDPNSLASRAIVIHSATLEALDSIECADELNSLGLRLGGYQLLTRGTAPLFTNDFSSLRGYTKYPHGLIISQSFTERSLSKRIEECSLRVLRAYEAVGMKESEDGDGLDVSFNTGEVINAKYVIGADGARSVIRGLSGIGFSDPQSRIDSAFVNQQVVLADVSFTKDIGPILSPISTSDSDPKPLSFYTSFSFSPEGFFLTAPLGHPQVHSEIYGETPSHPGLGILQEFTDRQALVTMSSDPSQNPDPISIKKVYWSTRFRTHSAVADTFLKSVHGSESKGQGKNGGIVMLVGDAAHIHSPAGGQGMNLAIRDAIGLGSVLARLVTNPSSDDDSGFGILEEFMKERHGRALKQIEMTKRFMWFMRALMNPFSITYWVIYFLGMIPLMKRTLAWQLSGLGNK
ncbi:FAD/NAD(P)-binding domain-containing protein [Dendrothele bispora CBS 962.96]|uniref:FAD/NAD(P)-binding domain-containing protein n=1 Tax=Dendrothele bispora (strain CBS 962.96) TaxID=1314807 RepID=A0A4S8KUD0_DENBC|nr:FAD/NAD(P)-binding domain-containing protein [Dendrothele bispora CBS 962.96]